MHLSSVNEYMEIFGQFTDFYMLEAVSGHWRIEIDERDQEKTTLTPHRSLYRFNMMPFGLKNSLASFQRAIYVIVSYTWL